MNKKQLIENIGGISVTSKMPCDSFNLSAFYCNTGSKLRKIKNSACSDCYALKGNYIRYRKTLDNAHKRKMNIYNDNHLKWRNNFVLYLNKYAIKKSNYWRWFDSGDLQSYQMLLDIIFIAKNTPNIMHWLPTHERGHYNKLLKNKHIKIPDNICIRVSAPMQDSILKGVQNTSSIHNKKVNDEGTFNCVAPKQDNQCLDCRACWDKDIKNINYLKH